MFASKIEVLVDFGDKPDEQLVHKTLNELKSQDGVIQAQYINGAIMVETSLPSANILSTVANTSGKRAVLQGFGETQSAVCMISNQDCCPAPVMGVIRFQQTAEGLTVADGSVDGLTPGLHGLHVHEVGDLSEGCQSIGSHYNPLNSPHGGPGSAPSCRHAGDLGNIAADETGRATFRIVDNVLKVWDIIGRSAAITAHKDDLGLGPSPNSAIDGNSGKTVACGIIARSAGVFENAKRVCACDGVVVWDERDRPLAGKGRRVEKEAPECCQKDDTESVEKKKCCC